MGSVNLNDETVRRKVQFVFEGSLNIVVVIYFSFLSSNLCIGQNVQDNFQYGLALKLNVEYKKHPNFKLSLAGGVSYLTGKEHLLPALHGGVVLFNSGPIGSDLSISRKCKIQRPHIYINGLVTIRLDKRDYSYDERFVPLYNFSDFTPNPLQNPFKSSVSLGAIFVNLGKSKNQRIGFLNVNMAGRAQLTYYNDGGYGMEHIGDKHDRYYTGGAVLSYHGRVDDFVDLIELSYHKYTGYTKYAFDVAYQLQLDYLPYGDKNQVSFNQQRWKINIGNMRSGLFGSISLYDSNKLDGQDLIHYLIDAPYHPDYYSKQKWAAGGNFILLSKL